MITTFRDHIDAEAFWGGTDTLKLRALLAKVLVTIILIGMNCGIFSRHFSIKSELREV